MGAPEGLTLRVMVRSSQELAALPDIATSARGRTGSHHRSLSPFLLDPMFIPLCMDPLMAYLMSMLLPTSCIM